MLTTLSQLALKYDAFILDLWGVIHDGHKLYPGVLESLDYLASLNKSVLFMSNAPRPAGFILEKLQELGVKVSEEMVLSSGDMVRYQLQHFNDATFSQLGRRFYHLGANRNSDLLAGLSVQITNNVDEANFILSSAYIDPDENIDEYDEILEQALQHKLPFICANPDKEVMNGDKIRYCSGVLAEKYKNWGGIVYYYGKPYLTIYDEAFKRLRANGIYHKNQMVMIGDTLETDIAGSVTSNIDSALVLEGNTRILLEKAKVDNALQEPMTFLKNLFQSLNVRPTWILQRFLL